MEFTGKSGLFEDAPQGRAVDSVVRLAEIDEDLAEGEELVGSASTAAETCLVFEDGGFHSG